MCRQIECRDCARELAQPVFLGLHVCAAAQLLLLARGVFAEARCLPERGTDATPRRAVQRAQLSQKHGDGPPVADNVVRGEQQEVLRLVQPHDSGAHQRTLHEVERRCHLLANQLRFCEPAPLVVHGRQVDQRNSDGQRGRDTECSAVRAKGAPQCVVPLHDAVYPSTQCGGVKRSGQPERYRLVKGAGRAFPHLYRAPNLSLLLGRRHRPRPRPRRRCKRIEVHRHAGGHALATRRYFPGRSGSGTNQADWPSGSCPSFALEA